MTNPEGNNVREVNSGCFTIVMLGIIGLCAVGIYQLIQSAA